MIKVHLNRNGGKWREIREGPISFDSFTELESYFNDVFLNALVHPAIAGSQDMVLCVEPTCFCLPRYSRMNADMIRSIRNGTRNNP